MIDGINVRSEIGKLKSVLLHRPGEEIENITPNIMERLLFDDIPYLKVAQKEHDAFARTLKKAGVKVYYLTELITGTIKNKEIREKFTNQFLKEANIKEGGLKNELIRYLNTLKPKEFINKIIAGVRKKDIKKTKKTSLKDYIIDDYPFYLDPMPNLYFTRDPFSSIGNGITLNHMRTDVRRRETIFTEYIIKYHPKVKQQKIHLWSNRNDDTCIEGGDELILNKNTLAVGISQRTDAESIEKIAKKLFNSKEEFETILAFDIPVSRAFMHLDTVFTMVDYDKFTIHPGIEGPLTVYKLTKKIGKTKNTIKIKKETKELDKILSETLGKKITLIRCGGGDKVDSGREQWNDGSNTLAIAPGEVVVYERNHITNAILKKHGLKLHIIPSSELSRGRGGPRCMSMPLYRDPLKK